MLSPERLSQDFVYVLIGLIFAVVFAVGVIRYVFWPVLKFLWNPRRSKTHRVSEEGARYRPYERRLVLAAKANNRRPGCVLSLSVALLFGLTLVGMGLAAGWEDYDWFGRIMTIAYALVAAAVLVLMLINFYKNAGRRAYDGREVQVDDTELIIDRSLIDSQVPGQDMFHPHLQRYLHKKLYYRIPLGHISRLIVSAMVNNVAAKAHQFPFVFVEFVNFDAVYMIQTRFMGGDGELRFLKHFEMLGAIPICVDEKYAEHYSYLDNAQVVRLE